LIKVWWMDRRLHLEEKETKNQDLNQETSLLSWMRKNMMCTSEYFAFAEQEEKCKCISRVLEWTFRFSSIM